MNEATKLPTVGCHSLRILSHKKPNYLGEIYALPCQISAFLVQKNFERRHNEPRNQFFTFHAGQKMTEKGKERRGDGENPDPLLAAIMCRNLVSLSHVGTSVWA